MSTTLYLLSLSPDNEALYLAAEKADADFIELTNSDSFDSTPEDELTAAYDAMGEYGDAWYTARITMDAGDQLPILEASHRDTEECELITLFNAQEHGIITVSDENIQEIADAWEDSNRKRTFPTGRGKGTVYGWLLAHRGERIIVSS